MIFLGGDDPLLRFEEARFGAEGVRVKTEAVIEAQFGAAQVFPSVGHSRRATASISRVVKTCR